MYRSTNFAETEKFFRFNPEQSVADMIKNGVLNTFFHFKDECKIPFGELREDFSTTLRNLAIVDIPPPAERKNNRQHQQRDMKFFSGRHAAIIEMFIDEDTNTIVVDELDAAKSPPSPSPEKLRSEAFRVNLATAIFDTNVSMNNKVVEIIWDGIYRILCLSEDCAGTFVDQFEKHMELLRQLGTLYEKAKVDDLDREKGCYSHGLALEAGLKAIEETSHAYPQEGRNQTRQVIWR